MNYLHVEKYFFQKQYLFGFSFSEKTKKELHRPQTLKVATAK